MAEQVIVVGGGLAGLSAAHTIIERGGKVLLLDKMAFLGGNSTKATSGINGALTRTQQKLKIPDSAETFEDDILKGAAGVGHTEPPEHTVPLAKVLADESGPAVDWLVNSFGLDLSKVSRLGGHSQPRTHRGGARFPGFTITYALLEKLEEIEAETKGAVAKIVSKAKVTKLCKDSSGRTVGCVYEKDGQPTTVWGPVVLATGGFGADFEKDSILMKNRPDLGHLPTTNGEHCTGDGIKMALAIGATTVDMKSVQVHPTGLVHPDEPDSKVKFLAAEALRGVGGILLDANGKRFADELGRRDYVSGEMWKNKGPFRLVLNKKGSDEIAWHCKHYVSRGVMKRFDDGIAGLAKEMGVSPAVLEQTFAEYNKIADAKSCPFGKKFFHNTPFNGGELLHAAVVTPIVHYTMGGLRVNEYSQVLTPELKPMAGLYAVGELMGGVHGRNRLGGNSLLDCVVFGRVAGAHVAADVMRQNAAVVRATGRVNKIGAHVNPTRALVRANTSAAAMETTADWCTSSCRNGCQC
eukprot:CAMPEP_0170133594 /NCGR_PEP_ID=MMETSP0033_2-20121228/1410_1 /TAXON_ID=195969 /ORGANISM="Dolichomastix tenuilepis, Strain CCMP3274" /LENGTH=522 /DNA_ID=CAMNT_0010369097 /DNA_START=14 /DNA_END=1582 /DNA_ORIENTATION=+